MLRGEGLGRRGCRGPDEGRGRRGSRDPGGGRQQESSLEKRAGKSNANMWNDLAKLAEKAARWQR